MFKNTKDNLLPEERNILNNFRAMPIDERNLVIRQQDKGNNFVFLDINLDEHKVKEQMDRGSFEVLNEDPTLDTVKEIDEWVNRWKPHGLSDKWVRYITSNSRVHPGVNYPLIKTHKPDNPARVITSGCGTPIENLSYFVEKYCKVAVDSISSRVRDTSHMLDIIDELNEIGISDGDVLVSFDIINMFPSIDNDTGIERVRRKLMDFVDKFDVPVECIIEALELCLKRNCSAFRGQYWLQTNGTAMGPKNSCSYADIVAEHVDRRVLESKTSYPELKSWFRFRDDTFALWRGTVLRLNEFFELLNSFDAHLQFTMDVGGSSLHFLDLLISISNNRLETSVYSKSTDPHIYLNANSCHPGSQKRCIAKGVALRLRRICSDENDFRERSKEYIQYLLECGHDKTHVVEKFKEVTDITREEARRSRRKVDGGHCVFSVKFNPRAPDIRELFRKHRSVIEYDPHAREILPDRVLRVSYKRNANLKELLAPSNPYINKNIGDSLGCYKCSAKRCDCCKNFLVSGSSFRSVITKKIFKIGKSLTCGSENVVYLAQCVVCGLQGVGSTINFKTRLANYKSHIKRKRRTCAIVNHFLDCHGADNSSLKFMLIDQRHHTLRECENFWIGTLLTNQGGLNGHHDFVQQ